ncbi:MAG: VWA domain-containing protein [Bryobacterales bacterium]
MTLTPLSSRLRARSYLLAGVCLLASCLCPSVSAVTVEVHNPQGGVHVKIDPSPRLRVEGLGANRPAGRDDIKTTRMGERIIVRCEPADGEPIDLEVQVPLGFLLEVTTKSGEIWIEGMVRRANIETETGSVRLNVPWRATRVRLDSDQKPKDVVTPRGLKFSTGMVNFDANRKVWRLRDDLGDRSLIYGELRIRAQAAGKVTLEDFAIPNDWPLKMPWQAADVLEDILRGRPAIATESAPDASAAPVAASDPPALPVEPVLPGEEEAALFRSDVRMVSLTVTATDKSGRPLTGLKPDDFRVVEDGAAQKVTFAGSDDVPFNLAILLDLSGSTRPDREAMRSAAAQFVKLLGPQDKLAIYALAGGMFHVVSELTADRERLIETIARLPSVSGASPLYDTMVLAYAEELRQRPGERNGLIVISDGIDNQLSRQEAPSKINFKSLVKAAGEMDALIYPIFLLSGERFGRGWSARARERMERLADASGGRLFPAASIDDLEPVFPELAQELRSVYSVAYYPENQQFDGNWRKVTVEVDRPGVVIRARLGYFAR